MNKTSNPLFVFHPISDGRIPPTKEDADILRKIFHKIIDKCILHHTNNFLKVLSNACKDFMEYK